MAHGFRRVGGFLLLLAVAVVVSGCGTGGRAPAARNAAASFEDALRGQDAEAMCALIAPGTRTELESNEKSSCPDAIVKQELPAGGGARSVDVYGRQARVVLDADTLFLSEFPGGWKVVAAGCAPEHGKPYHCAIKRA